MIFCYFNHVQIYLLLDILHKIPADTVNCCEVEMDQQWNTVGPSTGQSRFMLKTPSVSQKSITAYQHGNLRAPPNATPSRNSG